MVDRLHRGGMYSLLKPTGQIESGGPNVILEPVGNAGSYLFSSESDVAEFVGKFKRLNSESRC